MEFLYPHNMEETPRLGLWPLKNIAVLCGMGILSILCLLFLRTFTLLSLTALYAIMTITFDEDISIYKYIKKICKYFISQQLVYKWEAKK